MDLFDIKNPPLSQAHPDFRQLACPSVSWEKTWKNIGVKKEASLILGVWWSCFCLMLLHVSLLAYLRPSCLPAFLPHCFTGFLACSVRRYFLWYLRCPDSFRFGRRKVRSKLYQNQVTILATMNEPLHCQTLQFLTLKYNTQPLPSFFPSIWGTDWIASSLNGSFCKAFPFLLDFGAIAGSTDCNPSTPSNEFHPGRACNDLLPGQCAKKNLSCMHHQLATPWNLCFIVYIIWEPVVSIVSNINIEVKWLYTWYIVTILLYYHYIISLHLHLKENAQNFKRFFQKKKKMTKTWAKRDLHVSTCNPHPTSKWSKLSNMSPPSSRNLHPKIALGRPEGQFPGSLGWRSNSLGQNLQPQQKGL